MSFHAVNLALSNRCNAKCIWCPSSRGTKHNFDMSFDLVKKIIDEISDESFPHKIDIMHISENGEALYNKDLIDIARYIKQKMPDIKVDFLSNFGLMSGEISKFFTKEKLIDSIQVNIDGHDDKSYRDVKGISFKSVIKNLKKFLEYRERYYPEMKVRINVMPAFEYKYAVGAFFDTLPLQGKKEVHFSNYEEVVKFLREFVPEDIEIKRSKSGLWAERKQVLSGKAKVPIDNSKLDCPLLFRVENEAFIAPNGDWYPCCLDDNNDIVLGNVKDSTILEIYNSQVRNDFITKLKQRRFDEIGYPCNTVICCNSVSVKDYDNITKDFIPGSKMTFRPVEKVDNNIKNH